MVAALDRTNTGEIFDLYWDYEEWGAVAEKLYSDYAAGLGSYGKWVGKLGDARALAAAFDRITDSDQSRRLSLEERTDASLDTQSGKPRVSKTNEKQAADSTASEIITDGSHIKGGKLKPNIWYVAGENKYLYRTNQYGLIMYVFVEELHIKKHIGRLRHSRNTPGKRQGDHAGHLVGDLFGGSNKLDNLVSQLAEINVRKYRDLERIW